MKEIYDEFLQIFKEQKLIIAILAVISVPILYAGMFLWAFWDPYDHLVDLPIAVVNEDEGAVQDGENLQLGNELIDKLQEDPEFDFHFVDKEEGYRGLHDEIYYILLEIPKDFSENATTLMDHQPEKLNIIYTPNESYNFLASQIGETAMLQIKTALQEKITKSYAETIFDKIEEVADGLNDASDATTKLHDGAEKLQDGSKKLVDNLQVLSEKTIELSEGMRTANSGAGELDKGAKTLASGMDQLNSSTHQLLQASKDVKKGTNDLAKGFTTTNEGINELNSNVPTLVQGTNQVLGGITELQRELPKQLAQVIGSQINASSGKIDEGLTELQTSIHAGLTEQLAPEISANLSTAIADEIIATQKTQVEQLASSLLQYDIDKQTVDNIVQQLQQNSPSRDVLINNFQSKLSPKINDAMQTTIVQIDSGFNVYKSEVNKNIQNSTVNLESDIQTAVNPAFNELQAGVTTINEGQKSLESGVSQLSKATKQLQLGSQKLSQGQNVYVDNMGLFTNKFDEANTGMDSLVRGTSTLFSGLQILEEGSTRLSDGTVKLADGSNDLVDGLDKLVDGADKFNIEMQSATKKASDFETNDETYHMMASPVDVKNEKINKVPNYGTGFAPYFLSLGLFVGALLLSIVYPLREPVGVPKSGIHWFLSKFSILFLISILQAVIASGFLLIVLKLEVQSVPLFILFSIITSLVFITLIQFLVTCLDDPGRFIAIILLIMQLTTSAGTFPLELIPKVLQPINYFLPMTYSVTGFKAVISSGEIQVMWQNAGILFLFAITFMLLTMSYFVIIFKRKFAALQNT